MERSWACLPYDCKTDNALHLLCSARRGMKKLYLGRSRNSISKKGKQAEKRTSLMSAMQEEWHV